MDSHLRVIYLGRRDETAWTLGGQPTGLTDLPSLLRSEDIRFKRPDWQLFRDGCPVGESPARVKARADCVLRRVRAVKGDVPLISLERGRI